MGVNYFTIRQHEMIFLYGDTLFANSMFGCLKDKGYHVMGYIDQKYDGYNETQQGIKTGINGIAKYLGGGISRAVVIVCLQNGVQHEKAAKSLFKIGISKIIYLPMGINITLRKQELYRRAYQLVQRFEFEKIDKIPVYRIGSKTPFVIIDNREDEISFWCPIQFLHSATEEMIMNNVPGHLSSAKPILLEYADVEIGEHKPYIELFHYLQGKDADIDHYLAAMGRVTSTSQEALLVDRKKLYLVYEQSLRYNMQFFLDSPARCNWNVKGYFNVQDGMHRIQYLYSKGYQEAPIVTSIVEWERFLKKTESNLK